MGTFAARSLGVAACLAIVPNATARTSQVVSAIRKAALQNQALPPDRRLAGDALADHYVRSAAGAANADVRAFVVGLAHGIDPHLTLQRHPATRWAVANVETPQEQKARLKALGKPTLHSRTDSLLHLALSAALADLVGAELTEREGINKELRDMEPGGSGFSFADLLANQAGLRLRRWIAERPAERLPRTATRFRGAEHCPDPSREPEKLYAEEFKVRFGSVEDERFRRKLDSLRSAVANLPTGS